jgi:hypothetical protein
LVWYWEYGTRTKGETRACWKSLHEALQIRCLIWNARFHCITAMTSGPLIWLDIIGRLYLLPAHFAKGGLSFICLVASVKKVFPTGAESPGWLRVEFDIKAMEFVPGWLFGFRTLSIT